MALHLKQPVLLLSTQAPAKQQFSNGITVTPSGLLPGTGTMKLLLPKLSRLPLTHRQKELKLTIQISNKPSLKSIDMKWIFTSQESP